MEALFLKILSLSLGATYVAAAVIALRFLLKRTPRWIVCAMWGLVAIRLLCPFTLESAVSLAPSPDFRPVPLISANQPETPGQTPRPAAAQPGCLLHQLIAIHIFFLQQSQKYQGQDAPAETALIEFRCHSVTFLSKYLYHNIN